MLIQISALLLCVNENKMPIMAFTRDAVPDLFPLYASQIFKAILPSQLKYCVTVFEIIPEIFENVMTGAVTYRTHALFRAIYIFPIYLLHYIIRDYTGNCFRKTS